MHMHMLTHLQSTRDVFIQDNKGNYMKERRFMKSKQEKGELAQQCQEILSLRLKVYDLFTAGAITHTHINTQKLNSYCVR